MAEKEGIIINESFSDEDFNLIENIEESKDQDFESLEFAELRLETENLQDEKISELISYPLVKKNLAYDLPHQREGALKLLRDMNSTALLADEVGLGKTITAGFVIKEGIERGFLKKILILTPPSLVDQWVAELDEKFNLKFSIIEKQKDWDNNFVIASLDRVKIYNKDKAGFRHNKAHETPWDLLIVDEAHKLKEKNTLRWKFVDRIPKKRFLLLTATPFQNDLYELYNLLHLLKKGHLGTLNEFKSQFLNKGNKRYPLNPKKLKEKLDEVMIRRIRREIGIEYKKRIPRIIAVELTRQEKDIYDNICDLIKTKYFAAGGNKINGLLAIYSILPKITSSSRSAIESLQRIVSDDKYHSDTRELAQVILNQYKNLKIDSKIKKLLEIVKEVFEKDKDSKILIYTRHPTTLEYIRDELKKLNLKIVEFVGGLDRQEKTKRIAEFKNNADIMISTDTGAEGLNFQFCNSLINYDLPWNPMSVEQRIGRLDRIGQKRDMLIYSLATKDTMEEKVVDLIINKMCCVGLVIGELPIILFNLGLDSEAETGGIKIEEMLMQAFIDSKNNLDIFAQDVDKINNMIQRGIKQYNNAKISTSKLLD